MENFYFSEGMYLPEGAKINTYENKTSLSSIAALERAMKESKILEAPAVMCDSSQNLIVDLGICRGVIPREKAALVSPSGNIKDIAIITRVGKATSFVIESISESNGTNECILSRAKAQKMCIENYLSKLELGDVIDGRITHFEPFGAFVDIGCGVISLLSIDSISVSRIRNPLDRFHIGQYIKCVVKDRETEGEYKGRISLSHKELLGTWRENAALFSVGETVSGIVRSIENYGIFIELAPNLAGLAEYKSGVEVGQTAAVYIKNIIQDKKKVKLVIVDVSSADFPKSKYKYFITEGNVRDWHY